jgi:hypothetical protein
LNDGRVLVAGGENEKSVALSSAEIYDPATALWTTTGSMNTGRIGFTLSLLRDGNALAVGGYNDCQPCNYLKSTDLYDPSSGTWAPGGDLTVGRSGHAAARLPGGKLLVSGGFDGNAATASVEVYDPTHQAWATVGPMRSKRSAHTMTRLRDGRMLVTGGDNGFDVAYKSAELGTTSP